MIGAVNDYTVLIGIVDGGNLLAFNDKDRAFIIGNIVGENIGIVLFGTNIDIETAGPT